MKESSALVNAHSSVSFSSGWSSPRPNRSQQQSPVAWSQRRRNG